MKTTKSNLLKPVLSLFTIALLFTSCGQSEHKKDSNSLEAKIESEEVKVPQTNIQAAIISNNIEAVKQHIKAGTDLNKKDAMSAATPLITAASFGRVQITKLLLDANVDLSKTNADGATALHTAVFFCRTEVVQLLLNANADKNAKNNYGQTPIETITGPFEQVKPIYEMLKLQLQPMGMEIDIDAIEKTRPSVAKMLQ